MPRRGASMAIVCLLLTCLLGHAARAQETLPPVTGPLPATPGLTLPADATVDATAQFLVVKAETPGADVKWVVYGNRPVPYTDLGSKTIIVGTPAGAEIHLYAVAVVDGKLVGPARMVVTVRGGAAPPAPEPGPTPGPTGTVVRGRPVFVVIVEDPQARAKYPYLPVILDNAKLQRDVEAAGHTWRVLNVRDPEVQQKRLANYVNQAGGTPALLLMTADGIVHQPQAVPQTPAALIAALNRVAGTARAPTPPSTGP